MRKVFKLHTHIFMGVGLIFYSYCDKSLLTELIKGTWGKQHGTHAEKFWKVSIMNGCSRKVCAAADSFYGELCRSPLMSLQAADEVREVVWAAFVVYLKQENCVLKFCLVSLCCFCFTLLLKFWRFQTLGNENIMRWKPIPKEATNDFLYLKLDFKTNCQNFQNPLIKAQLSTK